MRIAHHIYRGWSSVTLRGPTELGSIFPQPNTISYMSPHLRHSVSIKSSTTQINLNPAYPTLYIHFTIKQHSICTKKRNAIFTSSETRVYVGFGIAAPILSEVFGSMDGIEGKSIQVWM
jgi:hypothetical protein